MQNTITKALSHLQYRQLLKALARRRTRAVVKPFAPKPAKPIKKHDITIIDYTQTQIEQKLVPSIKDAFHYHQTPTNTWINVDGLSKKDVIGLSQHYGIHELIQEDIISIGQRPKVDEIDDHLYALLNMLFVEKETGIIEQEQISIVLGKNYVISIQEDATRDVFDPVRKRLRMSTSKEREKAADYLFYALIDVIVDSYLLVIEDIASHIENIEEQILSRATKHTFQRISQLRKDIILLKRNVAPVRDLVASLVRSDSDLLQERTTKYFKDVYDHVVQANDLLDNYRDLIMGLQDMYVNNINLRMNEVMKTLAIITAIMAPATVIGGIFGMNFDVIPYSHHQWGFYGTIAIMLIIPVLMILWFVKRGWFQKDYPEQQSLF